MRAYVYRDSFMYAFRLIRIKQLMFNIYKFMYNYF